MPTVPVAEWVPDAAALGNPGSLTITNAVPALSSYQPMPELVANTGALAARPRGAIEGVDSSNNVYQYAGDETALYQLSGTSWTDVSLGGGYSTGSEENWEFVRWKEKILATNFSDNPQQITFGGTNFSNLTTALRCRRIAVIRDYVVTGNTFDATDGTVRDRVRWSAFDDETDFTVSPTTGSDFRDLKAGGGVQKIIGGEYGVVVSERSTFRMTYAGQPTWFQIDEVLPGVGAISPGAVTHLGDTVYFLSENGFIALTGGATPTFIGAGKVDKYVKNDIDQTYLYRMSAVADPRSGRVMWAYPGAGNTGGRPNKIVIYDRTLNRWGIVEQEVELIWRSGGIGTTLEELDDYLLGSELVSNGDFASGTGWTTGTGWAIGSGTATHSAGTASEISQSIAVTNDTYYRVEFDVSGRTAGSVAPELGGTAGTAISADTTDEKETIRAGADADIAFSCTSDFDGSIDNVSVKEINDMDSLAVSLDASQWKGGTPQFSGFNSSFENGNFSGSAMTATIETREVELNSGFRSLLNGFVPLVDGGTVTAEVGVRNRQADAVTYSAPISLSSAGRFPCRASGRYHRFRLTLTGEWEDAIGVQVNRRDARKAGARG